MLNHIVSKILPKSFDKIRFLKLHISQLSIFDSGALVINMLYIKASLTINTSISKMKYMCVFIFFVLNSAASFNITQSSMDFTEFQRLLHADGIQKHPLVSDKHKIFQLRRKSRDFTNTIDKIPTRIRNDMLHHQRNVRQTQMCNQAPCQKMPFIVSYQVNQQQSRAHKDNLTSFL